MSNPIRLVVSDIDGSVSDGRMLYDAKGGVSKSYHTRDCTALWLLKHEFKVDVLMLTGANHDCDRHRFKFLSTAAKSWQPPEGTAEDVLAELNSRRNEAFYPDLRDYLIQGCDFHEKPQKLEEYMRARGYWWENVAYFGDAENDLECIKRASYAGCPKDAVASVRECAHFISQYKGGNTAFYDFAQNVMTMIDQERK